MKNYLRTFISMILVCTHMLVHADVVLDVDWEDFLSRHDLLWNNSMDGNIAWKKGATLGNGTLGIAIYKEHAQRFRIEVSRLDAVDHREYQPSETSNEEMLPAFNGSRMPVGYFTLGCVGRPRSDQCTMRHDLWNNEVRAEMITDRGELQFRAFVHTSTNVIVFEVTTSGDESGFTWTWTQEECATSRLRSRGHELPSYEGYEMAGPAEQVGEAWVRSQELPASSRYRTSQPGQFSTAWRTVDAGSNKKIIYSTLAVSYPGRTARETALNTVNTAASTGLDALVTSHRAWWNDYYPRSFVSVPDGRALSYYWIQMMRIAATSRENGPMIDLMGPWFTPTNWPVIWWEVNEQITYLPYPTANRIREGMSLFNAFEKFVDNMKENVRRSDCQECISFHRATTQELVAPELKYKDGTYSDAGTNTDLSTLAWGLHDCWRYWRYSMDQDLLERLFPLMKMNVNFFLSLLEKESDGKYHLPRLYSPEYGAAPDCIYHLGFLKWECLALIDACERLNINDPLLSKWQDVVDNLADWPTDSRGYSVGEGLPMDKSHRHWSHLIHIYPTHLVNWDNSSERDIIKRSVDNWVGLTGNNTGFRMTGASSLYAAMGDGNRALQYFNTLREDHCGENTTHIEGGGPTIGASFHGAECIHNMLIQSWGNTIRVFPALPSSWDDVAFHDLLAEGGFMVSAVRDNDRTQFVRIKSLAGEPCRVKTDLARPLAAMSSRQLTLTDEGNNVVSIDLRKDEIVILHTEGTTPSLNIHPVSITGRNCNCFTEAYESGNCQECPPDPPTSVVWNPLKESQLTVSTCCGRGGEWFIYDLSGRRLIASNRKSLAGVRHTLKNSEQRSGVYLLVHKKGNTVTTRKRMLLVK